MTRRVFLKPRAENDVLDQRRSSLKIVRPRRTGSSLGVAATGKKLAENSGIGSPRHFESERLRGVRVWPVEGFPSHQLVYREVPEGVDILRVIHAARDIGRFEAELE